MKPLNVSHLRVALAQIPESQVVLERKWGLRPGRLSVLKHAHDAPSYDERVSIFQGLAAAGMNVPKSRRASFFQPLEKVVAVGNVSKADGPAPSPEAVAKSLANFIANDGELDDQTRSALTAGLVAYRRAHGLDVVRLA